MNWRQKEFKTKVRKKKGEEINGGRRRLQEK
jgi:hypothetical protein